MKICIFINFCQVFKFLLILKNERNVMNFRNVFVTRLYNKFKNFSGDWTNSFTLIALKFFSKIIFSKMYKNFLNNWNLFRIINNIIWFKKLIFHLFIYWTIFIIFNLLIFLLALSLYKINVLSMFNNAGFFSVFYPTRTYSKSNLI